MRIRTVLRLNIFIMAITSVVFILNGIGYVSLQHKQEELKMLQEAMNIRLNTQGEALTKFRSNLIDYGNVIDFNADQLIGLGSRFNRKFGGETYIQYARKNPFLYGSR